MPLVSGTRLGPYEIVGPIGAGGMGEVYRARDTRLERSVALKVLPAEFAHDAQFRLRLEREARAISQLEHPNICRLYDVGDGYLVMELLEGETLATRLARGPIPVREAVRLAIQIGDALDRAHRRGILHRDLKPGNVMVTKSGAKLLDFGLARPLAVLDPHGLDPHAATEEFVHDQAITGPNIVVGTCAYMSPEQIGGKELDARSDIFSFGILLYEMLSGRRPFTAPSSSDTMRAILEADPLPLSIGSEMPPALEQIVRRCLEKDRDDRFHSSADAAFALSTLSTQSSSSLAVAARGNGSRASRWGIAGGALLLAGVVALLGWGWVARKPSIADPIVRFRMVFPPNEPLALDGVAISPDGTTLAYVRRSGGTKHLVLRSISSLEETPVENSTGATSPFFSPDGNSIGFAAEGKLRRLRLGDRDPVALAEVVGISGASWGSDGTIVYSSDVTGTLFRIADTGGQVHEIIKLDAARHETAHLWPQILPDGHTVLFCSQVGFGTDAIVRIEAVDLRDGRRRTVAGEDIQRPDGSARILAFQWVDGRLLFVRDGRLECVRFDPSHPAAEGNAVTVVDPMTGYTYTHFFAVSRSGTLIYISDLFDPIRVARVAASGPDRPLSVPDDHYEYLAISPDERQLAVTVIVHGAGTIGTVDLERGTLSRFGRDGVGHIATWTPDGTRLLYSWSDGRASNVVSMRADATGDPDRLVPSPNHQDPGSVSPDGRWLAYAERDPATGWDIRVVSLTPPRTPRIYLQTPAGEYSPMISPDGHSIAYTQRARGSAPQVFVDSFPEPARRTCVGDGQYPLWSADGKTLYFMVDGQIFATTVSSDHAVTPPRLVTDDAYMAGGYGTPPYGAMKDGSLLVLRQTMKPTLTVVMHWNTELDRLMAAPAKPGS